MSEYDEPWCIGDGGCEIFDSCGNSVFFDIHEMFSYDISKRIIDCVNACSGYKNPLIDIAGLEQQIIDKEKENAALRAKLEKWENVARLFSIEAKIRGRKKDAYPGHSHDVAGIWDSDNGELAGTECAACAAYRAALAEIREES